MATMHASAITTATIRVAGQVPTDVTVRHLGTPEQEASLRIGELLIYLRDPHIAAQVDQLWAQAKASTSALPNVIGPGRANLPIRVGLVGVILRLGGDPRCTTAWMPGHPGVAIRPHVPHPRHGTAASLAQAGAQAAAAVMDGLTAGEFDRCAIVVHDGPPALLIARGTEDGRLDLPDARAAVGRLAVAASGWPFD